MLKTFQLILLVASIVLFSGQNGVVKNKISTWSAEHPFVQSVIENQSDLDDHELDGFTPNTILFIASFTSEVTSNQPHNSITPLLLLTGHIRAPPVNHV